MTKSPSQVDLLLVDDDDDYRRTVVRWFTRHGFAAEDAADAEQAQSVAACRDFDVAVFDMVMPGMSGLELLEKFKRSQPECEVILLTGKGTIDTAVEAMKLGAYDFLTKPVALSDLEKLVSKASERRALKKENRQLKALLERNQPTWQMVGRSTAMQEVFRLIDRAGPSEKAILIQGESGTGKELVARALHHHSPRAEKPLVVVNCAALPESLLESELFGHEKGAFTGAIASKPGLFEVADGGTLFIDEIGELPGALQAKLLRVLEDGTMRRVGSLKERRVNLRMLAATNRNLADEVREGNFREDLYYRINVMSLDLPPLRDRDGDIELLLEHAIGIDWQIEPDAQNRLTSFDWPGNVRQLFNAIDRAKIMADDRIIRIADLPPEVRKAEPVALNPAVVDADDLASIQREKIVAVLRREAGNKTRAADVLGIHRRKLYRLLDKLGIQDIEWSEA